MTDKDESVLVLPGRRYRDSRVYHTNSDCHRLGDNHIEKPMRVLRDEYTECTYCKGEHHGGGPTGASFRQKLGTGEIEI